MTALRCAAATRNTLVLLTSIILAAASGVVFAAETDGLSGPYFGQQQPGLEAEIFAPGLISQEGRYEFAISFAPGGERLLFTVQTADAKVHLLHSGLVDGFWTRPEPVILADGARRDEMEAFFSRDGRHIYFAPYDEGLDVRIWRVEIAGDEFVNPAPLAGPIEAAPAFYPTSASSGAIYYTNIEERKAYRARPGEDGSWQAEPLGLEFGAHAFVSPDESFVLVNGRADDSLGKSDIYVAFADVDGGWTTPVNLGDGVNSEYSETCPSLSDDGRYLFFSRYDEPGELAQIYWVDSVVIEAARQKQLIEQTVFDSIAWALTKDRARLESIIAHDDDYFSFHPEGLDGVHGYAEFERGFELWMDPRFEATRTDLRQFRCRLSRSGEVAWFSAILDDCYIWDGEPGCWQDTRWTGVLEKRDGSWVIVQMHFSFASDRFGGEVEDEMSRTVLVSGGEMVMGAEVEDDHQPAHRVQVPGFLMDRSEVTNAEYLEFCGATDHGLPQFWGIDELSSGPDFPDHPVVGVTWHDALAFCQWREMRLPTEAEWEYAARGGLDGMKFPWGDEIDPEKANYSPSEGTVAVRSFPPNGYGLYEMAGNVGEWVADWYDPGYYAESPLVGPKGPEKGKYKTVRGGGWHSGPYCNRVYRRLGLLAFWVDINVGFRCAADAPPESATNP